MNPYPAYRDSGVDWIGEIPEHWQSVPLKFIGNIVLGKMLTSDDKGGMQFRKYLRAKNIQWEHVDLDDINSMWFSQKELSRYILSKDDLLLSEGGEVGRTAIWNNELDECYIQNSVHKISIHPDYKPRFFMYQSIFFGKIGYYDSIVSQVSIKHLTSEKLKNIRFLTPPRLEQSSITDYLDHKTSLIDRAIAAKERRIELLQEYRSALINQAVTRGLDPDVPMKDSGIEWLGEIPSHWKIKKLKYVSGLQTGITLGKNYPDSIKLIRKPYLRVANVQDGYLELSDMKMILVPEQDVRRYELQYGDVVLTEGGDFDKLGRGHVWESQIRGCLHQNHIFAVRPDQQLLNPFFLSFQLASMHGRNYFTSTSKQTTNLASTNSTQLMNFNALVPPIEEQNMLVRSIKKKCSEIDETIDRINSIIDKLKHFRTALISSAITGKIDVRGWECPSQERDMHEQIS